MVKKIDSKLTKFLKDNYSDAKNLVIEHKIQLPVDKDFELRQLEFSLQMGNNYN